MLYAWLYPMADRYGLFNVFRYISFRTAGASLTAIGLSFLIGPRIIAGLRRLQFGQVIRSDGPASHWVKQGTPTMGGLIMLTSIGASMLLWMNLSNLYVWTALGVTFAYGAIGLVDDYLKVARKNSRGLPGRYKLIAQFGVALAAAAALYMNGGLDTELHVPFFKRIHPDLGGAMVLMSVLVMVGASNSVNLTDGLDGLATGPVITSSLTFMFLTYVAGHRIFAEYLQVPYVAGAGELAVLCGALIGAGMGFLWFNAYPAEVFMGDVGSLSLGGALGAVAVISKNELLLALVGGVFVVETLSVIAQVLSFKTRGKRIFLMAPIHHHFELKGLPEPKIIVRMWIVSIMLAMASLATLKLR